MTHPYTAAQDTFREHGLSRRVQVGRAPLSGLNEWFIDVHLIHIHIGGLCLLNKNSPLIITLLRVTGKDLLLIVSLLCWKDVNSGQLVVILPTM